MVALDLNLLPTSSTEPRPPNQQNLRGLTPTPLLPLGEGWGEGGAEGEDWEFSCSSHEATEGQIEDNRRRENNRIDLNRMVWNRIEYFRREYFNSNKIVEE